MNWLSGLLSNSRPNGGKPFSWQRKTSQNHTSVSTNLQELMNLQSSVLPFKGQDNKRSLFHRPGKQRSAARGHGVEFSDVRTYSPGDDTRHIDWRLTARGSHVMTRLYSEERDQPAYVLVDQRSPMYFGAQAMFKSVMAAQLGALLAWQYHASRKQLGGLVLSRGLHTIKINHSRQAITALLNRMVDANQLLQTEHQAKQEQSVSNSVSLSHALQQCSINTPAGTRVILISDFHDFDQAAQLRLDSLARQRAVTLYTIFDPVETGLDTDGLLGISDGWHRQSLRLSAGRSRQYRSGRTARDSHLQTCATNAGCRLIPVSTGNNPQQLASLAMQGS